MTDEMMQADKGITLLGKIHILYFSCGKHFDYLYISLKSLIRLKSKLIGNIYLYIDKEDFVDGKQLGLLNALRPDLIIRKRDQVTGWGDKTLAAELQAFKEVGEEVGPESYIAKVDSDIFFISDKIFVQVLESCDWLVGCEERYWEPFVYTQGGCYFLKNSLASKLISHFNKNTCSEVLEKINNDVAKSKNRSLNICPEDAAVYFLAKSITDKVSFENFYGNYYDSFHGSFIHFRDVDITDIPRREMLKFDRSYIKIPALLIIKYKMKRFLKKMLAIV